MFNALFGGKGPKQPDAPLVTLSEPPVLAGGTTIFAVGATKRRDIEHKIGVAAVYPAPGWQTWTTAGLKGEVWILSAFYRQETLVGVEYYVGKTGNVPKYAPRIKAMFRLLPVDVGLGGRIDALPASFRSSNGRAGGVGSIVYQHAFEARWTAGVALLSGNDGRIERIALYADLAASSAARSSSGGRTIRRS